MSAAANSHRPDAATIAAMVEEARGVAVAAADDVGLPFERENLELLCAVKANDPAAYERIRVLLKKTAPEVRVAELDRLIDKALGEGLGEDDDRAADPAHWTVEPWADPVDGAALADELVDVFTRHIVLPPSRRRGDRALDSARLVHRRCRTLAAARASVAGTPLRQEQRPYLLLWLCPRSEPASSISPSRDLPLHREELPDAADRRARQRHRREPRSARHPERRA